MRLVGGAKALLGDIWDNPFGGPGERIRAARSGRQAADNEQASQERKAKEAGDAATSAFKELMSSTLKVHIVSSDVKAEDTGGAATPSTNTLSPNPSGH